jgi:hypothetical protein
MARRRLNTRFLIATASVIGLVGGLGVLAYKNQKPRNPQPFIAAGDVNMKQGEFGKAIQNYNVAVDLVPQNIDLHLKLGKAYYELRTMGLGCYRPTSTSSKCGKDGLAIRGIASYCRKASTWLANPPSIW